MGGLYAKLLLCGAYGVKKITWNRTVGVDEADRQEEWHKVADEPQGCLDQPPTMLQVLVALVALILDAEHRQRQQAEEQLHDKSQNVRRCTSV